MQQKIVYYTDPLKDDFSGIHKKPIVIDKNYKYIHNGFFWKLGTFVCRLILKPILFIKYKLKFSYKVVNRKALKKVNGDGYFVYSNHTMLGGDAFLPSLVNYRPPYIVASDQNVSTKGTKTFIMMMGALPIPNRLNGMSNFKNALERRWLQGSPIVIYPEAHLWPYATIIRPYNSTSFKYPAELLSPVFASTTTFVERKRKTPKVVIYIDGPFYPNKKLTIKQNQQLLRDQVYECMQNRAKNNTYKGIIYERA